MPRLAPPRRSVRPTRGILQPRSPGGSGGGRGGRARFLRGRGAPILRGEGRGAEGGIPLPPLPLPSAKELCTRAFSALSWGDKGPASRRGLARLSFSPRLTLNREGEEQHVPSRLSPKLELLGGVCGARGGAPQVVCTRESDVSLRSRVYRGVTAVP